MRQLNRQRTRLRRAASLMSLWMAGVLLGFIALVPSAAAQDDYDSSSKTAIQVALKETVQIQEIAEPVQIDLVQDDSDTASKTATQDALKETGPIQDISDPLGSLVQLDWKGSKLDFQMKTSYEDIDPIVDQIREIVGWGGGSSYSGGNEFNFQLTSKKLDGHIRRSKRDKEFVNSLNITETVEPFRSLKVSHSDEGLLRITIMASQSAFLLRARQMPDGEFMVQQLDGTDIFAGEAASFDAFCQQYRDYATQQFLPAIKHFGLGQILTPYNENVQEKLIDLLAPWDETELGQIQKLTEGLNSEDFGEREEAFARLEQNYEGNESLLARLVYDPRFAPEIRARVRNLIREQVDEEQIAEMDFVDQLAKSLDADYLLDLAEGQTDPKRRALVIDRLRRIREEWSDPELSDQQVITLAAGQRDKAYTSDQKDSAEDSPGPNLLTEKGKLQRVSKRTGQLVKLSWKDDQLQIDREHWKKPFGGRSIAQLSKEIENKIADSDLPKDWYSTGGPKYAPSSAQHPQVIFEKLEEMCDSDPSPSHVHYHSRPGYAGNMTPNRQFDSSSLKASLIFDRSTQGRRRVRGDPVGSLDDEPFELQLIEKKRPRRHLLVRESKSGRLRILITGEESNYVVQLIVDSDLAIVQDVRGSKIVAHQADTFRELLEAQEEYCRESLFPLLRHLGIEIDEAIDAGPEGQKTTWLERNWQTIPVFKLAPSA